MKKQAVMLYVIKDGKILFLVRNKENDTVHEQGRLVAIGGKVEENESLEDAVRREAKEEAGISLNNIDLRAVMYFPNFGLERNDWVDYLFISSDYTGEITAGNEGHFVWKQLSELDKLNIYDTDKIFLKLLQQYSLFIAEFRCEGHRLIEYKLLKAL